MDNKIFGFILIMILISGCIEKQYNLQYINTTIINNSQEYDISENNITINNILFEQTHSVPNYIPRVNSFNVSDINTDIWYAQDPSSYVTPNNEWVKYYASQLFVDMDGRIKYKDKMVPWLVDENKNVMSWTNKPFYNNYDYGIYQEYYGVTDKNNIPWLMPDFYLYNDNRGVCSAWANTVTSLMLSGEMSIIDNNTFIKQIIPAKTVLGYTKSGLRDAWTEYQIYNKTYITGTMMLKIPLSNETQGGMLWEEKGVSEMRGIYEFTNEYFRRI